MEMLWTLPQHCTYWTFKVFFLKLKNNFIDHQDLFYFQGWSTLMTKCTYSSCPH
jgi:hypothetical protein